ncbi:MAG: hypothetical protein GY719_35085, partial [bacterium]|nr:hypothetical protein [bacterium]
MTVRTNQDAWTVRDLTQSTLDAWHSEDMDRLRAGFTVISDLKFSPGPKGRPIREWAWDMERRLISGMAGRTGEREKARLARVAAHERYLEVEQDVLRRGHDPAELEAAKGAMDFAAGQVRAISYGDDFQGGAGFFRKTSVPRTRAVSGDADADEFSIAPEVADLNLFEYLQNPDGSRNVELAHRSEVLDSQNPVLTDGPTGDPYVMTAQGRVSLGREFERLLRPENQEEIRRAMLGMSRGGGLELGPESIGAHVVNLGGQRGFNHDVETAHPAARLPLLPQLYPEEGGPGLIRSHDFLNTPGGLRAFQEVVNGMQEGGHLRPTVGEQAGTMATSLAEFVAVNKGIGMVAKGASKAAKVSKLANVSERFKFYANTSDKLRRMLLFENQGKNAVRPLGVIFDGRNIAEEIGYAVTRNAITGLGDTMDGVAEGAAEGIAEGLVHAGFRGMIGGSAWVAGAGKRKLGLEAKGPGWATPFLHPVKWASDVRGNPAVRMRNELSAGKSVRSDMTRRLMDLNLQSMYLDGASQMADAVVVGGFFGAMQGAQAEHGEAWAAMSTAEKAVAMARQLNGPEALGNMLTYSLASGVFTGASVWRSRAATFPVRFPDEYQKIQSAAEGVVREHLNDKNFGGLETFVHEFEQLRDANPGMFGPDEVARTQEESSWGGEREAATAEVERHGM